MRRATVALPLALALVCAGAAPAVASAAKPGALPAAAKPAPKVPVHKATLKDPLLAVRTKALADITVYGNRLSATLHTGAVSRVIAADEQAELSDAGVYSGVAIRDDRVAVLRARTGRAISAAVSDSSRVVQVAALELSVTTAADTHLAAADPLTDPVDRLTDEATTAAANGEDTTDLTDDLDAVAVDLESAQSDEATTVSDVLGLDSSASTADLRAAAVVAASDLSDIDQDISDAGDDLTSAQAAYDALTDGDTDPGDGS